MIDRTVTTVIDAERCTGCGDERVHAVIALGYPDETYLRPAGRKGYLQRYVRVTAFIRWGDSWLNFPKARSISGLPIPTNGRSRP